MIMAEIRGHGISQLAALLDVSQLYHHRIWYDATICKALYSILTFSKDIHELYLFFVLLYFFVQVKVWNQTVGKEINMGKNFRKFYKH